VGLICEIGFMRRRMGINDGRERKRDA